jgi:hypothetical protein
MTEFRTPTDISEKEKIVGGLITAGQLIFIVIGLAIMVGIGLAFSGLLGGAAFIIGAIIGLPIGIVFAFYKPHKLPMLQYIKLKMARRKNSPYLPNHNNEIDDIDFNYFEIERL